MPPAARKELEHARIYGASQLVLPMAGNVSMAHQMNGGISSQLSTSLHSYWTNNSEGVGRPSSNLGMSSGSGVGETAMRPSQVGNDRRIETDQDVAPETFQNSRLDNSPSFGQTGQEPNQDVAASPAHTEDAELLQRFSRQTWPSESHNGK